MLPLNKFQTRVIKRRTLYQHLWVFLLCTGTIFDFSERQKLLCPSKQTRIYQMHQFFFLGVFLGGLCSGFFLYFISYFISECRDIASVLFAIVVSPGLKSLDVPASYFVLWNMKMNSNGEKPIVSNTLLTDRSLLSCLDISDAKRCLQWQLSLKRRIFLVMTFSILGVFNFFGRCGLFFNVFICGNEFQLLAERKSVSQDKLFWNCDDATMIR